MPIRLPITHSRPPAINSLILAILTTLALLLVVAQQARAQAQPPHNVTIGVVADNEPYTFFEGRKPTGFSIDLLRLVEKAGNLEFDFRAGSWPDIYAAFLRGDLDAIDGISWRPDRAQKILFTEPYHTREIYLMQDSDEPLPQVQALEDLADLRVGVVEDIFYSSELRDAGLSVNDYDSLPSLVRALAFGWIDVAVGPKLTLEYLANQGGFRFLELHGPAPLERFAGEDFRIGVGIDNPALLERIQNGLNEIPRSQIDNLLQRWQEFGGNHTATSGNLPLDARQQQYLGSLGPVRVGFMEDYAPFSFTDGGRVLGLSVDIMNRLADLTGIQVLPVQGQWPELIEMLRNGDIDVLANMSYSPERESLARFTEPYHVIPNVVFTLDENLSYENLKDLSGYRIALGTGIYYEDTVRRILNDNTPVSAFNAQQSMFQALTNGNVDVVITALHSGNYWIRQQGISGARIAGELKLPGMEGEDLRFGVRPSLSPLADILNQGLASITPTEERVIENRWLGASQSAPANGDVHWTKEQQNWLDQRNREISICVDPDWMPLEGVRDGEHVGLAADALDLFSERGNLNFRLVQTASWSDTVQAARNRRCDLFPLAMQTPDRLSYMDFTSPYLEVPNVVLGRINTPFIQRLADLEEQPVGIVEGYAFAELLQRRTPSLNLVTVSSEQEGLRQLQNGELAGYITTLATASYYMESLGLADLKVIARVPADWSLSVATRNDEPMLQSIMQKLVTSLTAEDREQLQRTWQNFEIKQQIDYTLLWQILAVGGLITALLVYWNRKLGRLNRELATANAALSYLSVTDNLTGLGNRTYFDREYPKSFQWCQRHQQGFAVAMVDADLFKQINDTWGHDIGDQCLSTLADIMRQHFRRDTDRMARFGGEEFVIFTSYRDISDITDRLEDFRKAIANQYNGEEAEAVSLSVSIGLAWGVPTPDSSASEFLRLADQALYRAKHKGRNRLERARVSTEAQNQTTK
ncbi:MAG: transporter substrate-binding domain-containing protein [Marinobacter sp.]|nr:transporter substrate-binding domain-containing protein [Marinobacter sp.]